MFLAPLDAMFDFMCHLISILIGVVCIHLGLEEEGYGSGVTIALGGAILVLTVALLATHTTRF